MQHKLKILPQYFKAVKEGTKTFEIRKNDRGFKVGDTLLLQEYEIGTVGNITTNNWTGQEITKEATYILEGGQCGLEEGYCILGLKPVGYKDILNELIEKYRFDAKKIQETYERYMWNIDYYKDAIKLKNIDLTGISEFEQTQKVIEEEKEFAEAYFDYSHNKTEEDKINVMDELLDEFQSKLGLLEKEGIKAEEVQSYYSTWVKKLENRPRIKECSKCINKSSCCLYRSRFFQGEHEAEKCKTYKEQEE